MFWRRLLFVRRTVRSLRFLWLCVLLAIIGGLILVEKEFSTHIGQRAQKVTRWTSTAPEKSAPVPLAQVQLPPTYPVSSRIDANASTVWNIPRADQLWLPVNGTLLPLPPVVLPLAEDWRPDVCFVARSYLGQDPMSSIFGVDRFLAALLMQRNQNYEVVLLDSGPLANKTEFAYLHTHVQQLAKVRGAQIKVVRISDLPAPPPGFAYPQSMYSTFQSVPDEHRLAESFHSHVYWLTDMMIRLSCDPGSKYVVATNGDNYYHPDFVDELLRTAENWRAQNGSLPDGIGVDWYSRHMFTGDSGHPNFMHPPNCSTYQNTAPCMRNFFEPLGTDLGANAWLRSSMIQQWKYFYNSSLQGCLYLNAHDGCFANKTDGWSKIRIQKCLYSHAPNAWQCFAFGGQGIETRLYHFRCLETASAFMAPEAKLFPLKLGSGPRDVYKCYFNDVGMIVKLDTLKAISKIDLDKLMAMGLKNLLLPKLPLIQKRAEDEEAEKQ